MTREELKALGGSEGIKRKLNVARRMKERLERMVHQREFNPDMRFDNYFDSYLGDCVRDVIQKATEEGI